jgi:AcrR family transcriptional regulator
MTAGTHSERVKARILAAGLDLWSFDPASVSARRIGKRLDMTHGAILYHYANIDALKHAIAVEAVRVKDAVIVPQLIAAKHPAVADLPDAERRRYMNGC